MLDSFSLSGDQRRALNEAATSYAQSLTQGALNYLLEERGLTQSDVDSARLGLVTKPAQGHDRFVGMISIPYLTPSGVVALKFRRIDGSPGPKYDSPAGQKPKLYNVLSFRTRETHIAVCEGEFDAIVMSACGIPAVGVPGVNAWQPHFARCFADFEKVFIVTDNDDKEDGNNPGQALAKKLAKELSKGIVIEPPRGLDVTEWFQKEGREVIRERVLG